MPRQSTIDAFLANKTLRKAISRSASSDSTLSCIMLNNERSSTADSLDASSTPPTSIDGSHMGADAKQENTEVSQGRSKRARGSVATYNENALSRNTSTRRGPAPDDTSKRDLFVHPLVPSPNKETRDRLVHDSIQVLNLDWQVDVLPGERLELGSTADSETDAKPSKSRSLLKKASAAMVKTKSVLGKRTREIIDAGKNSAREVGRRASTRILQQEKELAKDAKAESSAEPDAKKRKLSQTVAVPAEAPQLPEIQTAIKRKPTVRPRMKRWLAQGLYVGQEPGFDPRFKPGDNSKRAQKAREKQNAVRDELFARKRTMLPMPMFAGKRMMESGRDFKVPFDVFNPLPPGQPKPDEWRKTARNVFVGDAAEYWKVNKKLEYSTCICTPESGCDEDCFNRFMFYECDKNNCNIGEEHCTNRSFEDLRKRVKTGGKYNIGVEVMKTENKGYGVRSCRTFEPGQIIVEYTGEIITQDECDHRMRTIYKDNECFYLMMFDQNMIIDATRGSIARFVNHSCEPNCRMVKWTVDGKPRMALFAGDGGIITGEELTYDYNFDPFSAKNIQDCHCGMPSCRGVLGPRPKDREPKDNVTKPPTAKESAKRKLKDVIDKGVEGVKSKKRRLSADMAAVLKEKSEERAARAALRADIRSSKSKRVVAAKLIKKKPVSVVKASRDAATGKVTVKVSKRAATGATATTQPASPAKAKKARSLKASGSFAAKNGTISKSRAKASVGAASVRRSIDTVRSNVVRTLKGANRPAGVGKTIAIVKDNNVFDVPDQEA